MKTTFIVSGYMRTGTSMMMNGGVAGGLIPAFNPVRDTMNSKYGDDNYKPNPNGFYEFSAKEFKERFFPRKYEGKLIKVLYGGLPRLCVGRYKVVFMLRNPEEIRQSYEAFFEEQGTAVIRKNIATYTEDMDEAIARLFNRRDTEVVVMQYREVVNNPFGAFENLRQHGWPIDVNKAAATVDPALCRFKLEELEPGI